MMIQKQKKTKQIIIVKIVTKKNKIFFDNFQKQKQKQKTKKTNFDKPHNKMIKKDIKKIKLNLKKKYINV